MGDAGASATKEIPQSVSRLRSNSVPDVRSNQQNMSSGNRPVNTGKPSPRVTPNDGAGKQGDATAAILDSPPFVVRVFEWVSGDGSPTSRGIVQSKSLGVPQAGQMLLKDLRAQIAGHTKMSNRAALHPFCTPSGMPVLDEKTMTLADYLRLEDPTTVPAGGSLPSVSVFYKLSKPSNDAKGPPPALPELPSDPKLKFEGDPFEKGKRADAFTAKDRGYQIETSALSGGSNDARDAGYLTEIQWAEVLQNCGIMHGWTIDPVKQTINRAPKAAFRLRSRDGLKKKSTSSATENPSTEAQKKIEQADLAPAQKTPKAPVTVDTKPVTRSESDPAKPKDTTGGKDDKAGALPAILLGDTKEGVKEASAKGEKSGGLPPILLGDTKQSGNEGRAKDNNSEGLPPVLLGDKSTDAKGDKTGGLPAVLLGDTKPSGKDGTAKLLPTKGDTDKTSPGKSTDVQKPSNEVTASQNKIQSAGAGPGGASVSQLTITDDELVGESANTVMPSFVVNDDSHIRITLCSNEFEVSMAQNDFSSQSTEGSIGGGFSSFSAKVSGGMAESASSGKKQTNNKFKSTMIANYLFPRADIFLHPSDIVPTLELKKALEKVSLSKNVADLRKIYEDFGQIFCNSVTVGGRLQSTKIKDESSTLSEQEQKQQFKMSVGVQASGWGVSVSASHSRESGRETTNSTAQVDKQESNVFEAVGGNTILASSPTEWAGTVKDYRTWRVIERRSLTSLPTLISQIPTYPAVMSWFLQAGPTLAQYLRMPDSGSLRLRFRLNWPRKQLSLSYTADSARQLYDPVYYLGSVKNLAVNPQEMIVRNFSDDIWRQEGKTGAPDLFAPASFSAPVLLGWPSEDVIKSSTTSPHTTEAVETTWTITSPLDPTLKHGSKVYISVGTSPSQALTIFRNRQGIFVPALTDASVDNQIWRIMKFNGDGPKSQSTGFLKEGDEIYFCWTFKDQSGGFRDFRDDPMGRRTRQAPKELKNQILYLKIPWPRFESIAAPTDPQKPIPNSFVMSEVPMMRAADRKNEGQLLSKRLVAWETIPTKKLDVGNVGIKTAYPGCSIFAVQDVSFKIDVVDSRDKEGVDAMYEQLLFLK